MEHVPRLTLLDERGNLLDPRINTVLEQLLPKFWLEFPTLRDELVLTEVFEEAARRLTKAERRHERIENLHRYAWATLRSVAASRMRRGPGRIDGRMLPSDESDAVLSTLPSALGTAEQIEGRILLGEISARLPTEEWLLFAWKFAGYSSQQIARHRGSSVEAVDMLISRARAKVRRLVGVEKRRLAQSRRRSAEGSATAASTPENPSDSERADEEPPATS